MSIFSRGGTSYPDVLIVCYMIICSVISTILNPAVFIYNYWRKQNSVPVFLFRCLAVLDFLTCIFIPVKVVLEALPAECSISQYDRDADCSKRSNSAVNADIPVKFYSLVAWVLVLTPNFVAAVMAICRYIQIRFPFFPLELKHLTISVLVYGSYTISLSGYVAFSNNSYYRADNQILTNTLGIRERRNVTLIYTWPSMVCQILSVGTSIMTIVHLSRTGRQQITEQSAAISRRSSLKILLLNFGSILNYSAMICSMTSGVLGQFFTIVLAPVFMSCFNPIVFIIFTPNFTLSVKTRPHGTR